MKATNLYIIFIYLYIYKVAATQSVEQLEKNKNITHSTECSA